MPKRRPLRRRLVIASLVTLLAGGSPTAPSAGGRTAAPPRLTVIADSVAAAVAYDDEARRILTRSASVDFQVAACRRVGQTSCPYKDTVPPTVIDLVPTLAPRLQGATVIVAVGYNDFEQAYAENIDDALNAIEKAGAARVLWVTLRSERPSYSAMNEMIRAASARHPSLVVVDWNAHSRGRDDWFQPDGLHLNNLGAIALARLLRTVLVEEGVLRAIEPLRVPPVALAALALGRSASRPLAARGGTLPYRWTRASGRLPRGLRLAPAGKLVGRPAERGRFGFVARVSDATGTAATRRFVLDVR